jgi:hypothetical protein
MKLGRAFAFGRPFGFGRPVRSAPVSNPAPNPVPANALTFANGEPLQFSNGAYLELASL